MDETTWFEKRTFGQLLDDAAERFGDRVFLRFQEASWTFAELEREVDALAKGLLAHGVRPGDLVVVWLPNRPEWVFFQFAVAKVGGVFAPINSGFRARELADIIEHARPRCIVLAARSGPVEYLELYEEARARLAQRDSADEVEVDVIVLDEVVESYLSMDGLYEAGREISDQDMAARSAAVSPDDFALLLYTSGSTGTPKGVMHSHKPIRNVIDQANRWAARETDVILMYLPLFHALALYEGPLLSLVSGARLVLLERFEASAVLRAIETEKATMCFGFHTHFQDMLDAESFGSFDLRSLRAGMLAAGPRSVESAALRAQRAFDGKLMSAWGLTEVGTGATLGFLDDDESHRVATSGYPIPGYEIRIVDRDTQRVCDRGSVGEVQVRTYHRMLGYFQAPELTQNTFDGEWLLTGDMGVLEEDGYLRILGRYKDILKVGGENVDPSEVEEVVSEHPSVATAVVTSAPDDRLGEVVCLSIVVAEGYEGSADVRERIQELCRTELAHFKRPKHIIFVDEIPRSAAGKIHRAMVRDRALKQLRDEDR